MYQLVADLEAEAAFLEVAARAGACWLAAAPSSAGTFIASLQLGHLIRCPAYLLGALNLVWQWGHLAVIGTLTTCLTGSQTVPRGGMQLLLVYPLPLPFRQRATRRELPHLGRLLGPGESRRQGISTAIGTGATVNPSPATRSRRRAQVRH